MANKPEVGSPYTSLVQEGTLNFLIMIYSLSNVSTSCDAGILRLNCLVKVKAAATMSQQFIMIKQLTTEAHKTAVKILFIKQHNKEWHVKI